MVPKAWGRHADPGVQKAERWPPPLRGLGRDGAWDVLSGVLVFGHVGAGSGGALTLEYYWPAWRRGCPGQ